MIVVSAGTREFRLIVEAQQRKCRDFGYGHKVYDLGGLGIGECRTVPASDFTPQVNGDSLPPATFKAGLVLDALKNGAAQNELVCWMDADCLPLHDFNFPGTYGGFDAAVTLRPGPEIGKSNNPALDYLNSGVVWIRNTPAGLRFCAQWERLSVEMQTDQGALNECVVMTTGFTTGTWDKIARDVASGIQVPVINIHNGASVLVLDAMEWNCWHPHHFAGARIAHFKRGIRHLAKDYLARLVKSESTKLRGGM